MHLDMNLLVALDALLEEVSVSGAADRLHITPPAMSRTLARVREATGDQILVRSGRSMIPTPHALAIYPQVHALVQQARAVLAPQQQLQLATLSRSFTLQCHDAITSAIGPLLLAALQAQAPGVSLRMLAEGAVDTNELRNGQVDLEIGSNTPSLPEIHFEQIGSDTLAAVVRAGHPLTKGKLNAKRYAAALHITVSRRGRLQDPVDQVLLASGLSRRVVASVPTSAAALQFVGSSDVVALFPEKMCGAMVQALGLRVLPLPIALDPVAINYAWHQRYDGDLAHKWLRAQVIDVFARVLGDKK